MIATHIVAVRHAIPTVTSNKRLHAKWLRLSFRIYTKKAVQQLTAPFFKINISLSFNFQIGKIFGCVRLNHRKFNRQIQFLLVNR